MTPHFHPKRIWTAEEDALLRSPHVKHREAARQLNVSEALVRKARSELPNPPPPFTIPASRCQRWWPLPAGSEESWNAISDTPWPGPRV